MNLSADNHRTDRQALTLTGELVLWGYKHGLFPMANEQTGEILWFCPDPRAIIELSEFHVPRTLRQVIRQNRFRVTIDRCFDRVIRACAGREHTWISPEIVDVYCRLHRRGFAHSVETWRGDKLAGGLYGVAVGGAFFGESMFHRHTNASKVALAALVQQLRRQRFILLDTQYATSHLARLGASTIPRDEYTDRLTRALALSRRFVPNGRSRIVLEG